MPLSSLLPIKCKRFKLYNTLNKEKTTLVSSLITTTVDKPNRFHLVWQLSKLARKSAHSGFRSLSMIFNH